MEIPPPSGQAKPAAPAATGTAAEAKPVSTTLDTTAGKTFKAEVVQVTPLKSNTTSGGTTAPPANQTGNLYQVLLNANQQTIKTTSNHLLQVGDQLQLQWKSTGALAVLGHIPKASAAATDFPKNTLTNQQLPTPLLNLIQQLQNALGQIQQTSQATNTATNTNLENTFLDKAFRLLQNHLDLKQLTTDTKDQVKRALTQGGNGFEKLVSQLNQGSQLSKGNNNPLLQDNKANLGSLLLTLNKLQQTPLNLAHTKPNPIAQSTTTNNIENQNIGSTKPTPTPAQLLAKLFPQQSTVAGTGTTTSSDHSKSLQQLTQSALLVAARSKPPITPEQIKPNEWQAFAQFLLNQVKSDANASRNKANEKNDQILQLLIKNIATAIFRVQWNQLNSLPVTEDNQTQSWQFDLPLMGHQDVHNAEILIIKEEESNSDNENEKQKVWKVQLDFEFDEIGKMHAELLMRNEDAKATLWSELEATFQKTFAAIGQLEATLLDLGFNTVTVAAEKGLPKPKTTRPITQSLIDVRT